MKTKTYQEENIGIGAFVSMTKQKEVRMILLSLSVDTVF
jgi:hypothetical protein